MRAHSRSLSLALAGVAGALVVAACATLGEEGPLGINLPNTGVGPFRKLGTKEVPGVAPNVLDVPVADYAEPSALALSDDPTSASVALYVDGPSGAIHRSRASDARSFYGTTSDPNSEKDKLAVALSASETWEGGYLHSPEVLRVGATIYLYYAAAGGIGFATSTDGLTFTKHGPPVLVTDPSVAWEEAEAPTEPSVAILPSGTWHMLYAAGTSIGEATSPDGVTWTRTDADPSSPALDPVLGPQAFDAATLAEDASPPFDSGQVGDPCITQRITPAGRVQVLVLYTGYEGPPSSTATRPSAIGLAGRYGESGPLTRSGTPVYTVSRHERAPTLFTWSVGTMLYVSEDAQVSTQYPAVAAGIAPATITLPLPGGFTTGP